MWVQEVSTLRGWGCPLWRGLRARGQEELWQATCTENKGTQATWRRPPAPLQGVLQSQTKTQPLWSVCKALQSLRSFPVLLLVSLCASLQKPFPVQKGPEHVVSRWECGWGPHPLQPPSCPQPFRRGRPALSLRTLWPSGPPPSAVQVGGRRRVMALGDMTGAQLCTDPPGTGPSHHPAPFPHSTHKQPKPRVT